MTIPPSSLYTHANSLSLHYLESGTPDPDATPILLLHGFPTSSYLYRSILPELGKTHQAIALDLPGYGLSDKPLDITYGYDFYADTLDAFLEELGVRNVHLCLHDLGGPIGLYWALRHPGRVPKLILLNTLVSPETSWPVKLFLAALKTPGLRDIIVSPKGIASAMKLGVVHKSRLDRETLVPYVAPFESPAARRALTKAASGVGTAGLAKIAPELASYQTSFRLIYGEEDLALPDIADTMKGVRRDHPDADLTPIPDCGHFLQEDEPETVADLISEFLNTITPHEVTRAYNAWAPNDIGLTPAAFTRCNEPSLPNDPRALMRLLPAAHKNFFDRVAGPDYQTLRFAPPEITTTYDPTPKRLLTPSETFKGQQAQSNAKAYFQTRPIHFTQVTGNDRAHDLYTILQVALDPTSSHLFTFLTALSD